jgi:hypothetical protein
VALLRHTGTHSRRFAKECRAQEGRLREATCGKAEIVTTGLILTGGLEFIAGLPALELRRHRSILAEEEAESAHLG